jgi:alpha-tubulin suppressor-like RCC1 family protein
VYPRDVPPNGRMWVPLLGVVALCATGGCSARPRSPLGSDCELSSECAAPLVCRLGRCRDECRSSRDCRAGLVCLIDDALGVCQLETETCALTSECPEPLVCHMGRCANACMTSVDCPVGTTCVSVDGVLGCRGDQGPTCAHNSDCATTEFCGPDLQCHEQCHGPRDCRDGTVCDMTTFACVWPSDGGPGSDASIDGGMADSGVTTGPAPPPAIAGGDRHTCAIAVGELRCWGTNGAGQLGDGTTFDHHAPMPVTIVDGASAMLVTTAVAHSCATDSTGLYCWGDNTAGQVGNGSATLTIPTPVLIAGGATTSIASGHDHTCAIRGGVVECWGDNTYGQLGDGGTTPHRTPTATLPLLAAPLELSARGRETCALLVDGRVQCWGENADGQLGNGTTSAGATSTPQLVVSLTDAVEVAVGATHACARRRGGEVVCWGSNELGALGDGSPTVPTHFVRETPGPVPAIAGAVEIGAGLDHVCARVMDGRVFCWGGNTFGQVGVNNLVPMPWRATPAEVLGLEPATELAVGDSHTCARTALGLRCWGANMGGQLGDGTTMESFMPVSVSWP